MKIFLVIAVLFISVSLVVFYRVKSEFMIKKYDKTLKVGINLGNLVYPIDPLNNATLTNAFFSNNLYSNLVEVDENNKYILDLASKYWFDKKNKKIIFEFENSRIKAQDAAFSLKRLVYQSKHLHADFWKIICDADESVDLCSSRIYIEDNKLHIQYADEKKSDYIIPTLASVDYKIIPVEAFDKNDYKVAQIVDYSKTSGHYYLTKIEDKFFLNRNKNSPINIYKTYELVNISAQGLENEIESGFKNKIDIISTTVILLKSNYEKMISAGWSVFSTHQINIGMLVFTKNGLAKTDPANRFDISKRIYDYSSNLVSYPNSKPTVEFFQDFGQGYMSSEQQSNLQLLREKVTTERRNVVTFGLYYPEKWKNFMLHNPDINVVKSTKFPPSLSQNEQPDIYVMLNDVSFDLNLSLISYAANTGLLDMSKDELNQFANITDEQEKIKFINQIHYRTLKNCQIYPMWASPYTTAFNGDFEHNLSKFNSRTLLWKIH